MRRYSSCTISVSSTSFIVGVRHCAWHISSGDRNVQKAAHRLVRGPHHAVQQGRLGRFRGVPHAAEIPAGSGHIGGADHGLDRRDLDALSGGEEADHRRVREDEDAGHADLLRLHRQQHGVDHRQRPLRQGQRRRRRDPGGARLYLRAGKRHRALLPRRGRRHRPAARHLQQPAAGEERPALGSSHPHLQASELRGAQGIDRARRTGGAGARRQAEGVRHVLRQPQSRAGGADHVARRPRHRQHDRQRRAGRARHHLHAVDELRRGGELQERLS